MLYIDSSRRTVDPQACPLSKEARSARGRLPELQRIQSPRQCVLFAARAYMFFALLGLTVELTTHRVFAQITKTDMVLAIVTACAQEREA